MKKGQSFAMRYQRGRLTFLVVCSYLEGPYPDWIGQRES